MTGAADLDGYLGERLGGAGVAGHAAALVVRGRIMTAAGGNAGPGGAAVDEATSFHVCSCSKAFTALVFARLVGEGAADWDAPVAPVLPEFALADPWITAHATFRDLAAMRLGLDRNGIAEWGFRPDGAPEDRIARARFMGLAAPFRDRFAYSNLSYVALSVAASRLAGRPFPDLLDRYAFAPLGLADASFGPTPRSARPHMPRAGRMAEVPELTGPSSQGTAQVHLSARDAGRWIAAMLEAAARAGAGEGGELGPLFACQSLQRPPALGPVGMSAWGYGFGWGLADLEGRAVLTHGGGGRGWRARMVLDPQGQAAAMVMLAHEGDEAETLALELLDLAAGRRPVRRPSPPRPALDEPAPAAGAPLADPCGAYRGGGTGRVRVWRDADGALRLAVEDAPAFDGRLQPTADGDHALVFDSPALARMPADPVFRFRFGAAAGGAQAVSAYFGRLQRPDA